MEKKLQTKYRASTTMLQPNVIKGKLLTGDKTSRQQRELAKKTEEILIDIMNHQREPRRNI